MSVLGAASQYCMFLIYPFCFSFYILVNAQGQRGSIQHAASYSKLGNSQYSYSRLRAVACGLIHSLLSLPFARC